MLRLPALWVVSFEYCGRNGIVDLFFAYPCRGSVVDAPVDFSLKAFPLA